MTESDDTTDDAAAPEASPDLTRDVVPTIGNLTPSGLPLLPAASSYEDVAPASAEPDPDDPRWER